MNCHHEFPGLECCVTPHPEREFGIAKCEFEIGKLSGRSGEEPGLNSELRNPQFEFRNPKFFSALHADHLLDLGNDLNQVFLVLHHRLD